MPFASAAQERLMRGVAHGMKPRAGGPTQAVARQFVAHADKHKPARLMGGSAPKASPLLQTADRTLANANARLEGMPGRVRQGMRGKVMMAKGGSLSRKHFKAMADILKSEGDMPGGRERNEAMAHRLADYLSTENPRFDRKRFMEASGYDDAYFSEKEKRMKGTPPVKKARGGRAKLRDAKDAAYAVGGYAKGGRIRPTGLGKFDPGKPSASELSSHPSAEELAKHFKVSEDTIYDAFSSVGQHSGNVPRRTAQSIVQRFLEGD